MTDERTFKIVLCVHGSDQTLRIELPESKVNFTSDGVTFAPDTWLNETHTGEPSFVPMRNIYFITCSDPDWVWA